MPAKAVSVSRCPGDEFSHLRGLLAALEVGRHAEGSGQIGIEDSGGPAVGSAHVSSRPSSVRRGQAVGAERQASNAGWQFSADV
jgi:hypothetical protein